MERAIRSEIRLAASSLAFYALVSLAPFVILVMWIASLVLGDQRLERAATVIGQVAPKELGADRALRHVAQVGTGLGVTALVTAIWPAMAYGSGLARAFEELAGRRRRMQGLRGRGLLFMALLPLFVLGSILGSFAATQAVAGGERIAGLLATLAVGTAVAFAVLVVVFRVFAPMPLDRGTILRASATVLVGITVLSLLFALFVALGTDFERRYATSGLAGVVLVGVWLFVANAILLVVYEGAIQRGGSRRG